MQKDESVPALCKKRIEGHGVIITQSFSSPDIFIVYKICSTCVMFGLPGVLILDHVLLGD